LEAVLTLHGKTPEEPIGIEGHYGLTYQHIIEVLANTDKEYQISVKADLYMVQEPKGDLLKYLKDFLTKVISQYSSIGLLFCAMQHPLFRF